MKTIVRIQDTIEGIENAQRERLSGFGLKQFVESFAKRRADFPEGLMIVDVAEDGRPVYVVTGSRPPQIIAGQRRVHAVFWPVDSQEPAGTFAEEAAAQRWASAEYDASGVPYLIREIDSTDRIGTQVSLATMVWRDRDMLFCRMKGTKEWTLPEGAIGIGETIAAATKRSVLSTCGIEIDHVGIPARVPYVSTYMRHVGQHFLTVVMYAKHKAGEIAALEDTYDRVEWFPAKQPPRPLFGLVQGVVKILSKYDEPVEATAQAT